MRIREADVRAAVVGSLVAQGFRTEIEFPLLGRIADVLALKDEAACVAVECKERDWRRGVKQARVYQVACEFVYLALPAGRTSDIGTAFLLEQSLGLLEVTSDGRVTEVVAPRQAPHFLPELKERMVARLEEQSTIAEAE